MTNPHVLCFETYDDWDFEPMEKLFTLHQCPSIADVATLTPDVKNTVQAFAFKGHSSLDASVMDVFPNLGLIANYGVGYDTIDVAHAASRGIAVTNTPDVLTDDVANLAIGMLLSLTRDIVGASNWVRTKKWAESGSFALQSSIAGKSIGIVGMGRIGKAIGMRLQGFNVDIHYFARSDKEILDWTYHDKLIQLAERVDVLMVAIAGGPNTAGIIASDVIDALGKDAYLVNSARGTTVDEEALIVALQNGGLRGAALDVFNNEPRIDDRFFKLDNILLQPHHSSGTIETRKRMGLLQRENLVAFFDGKPLLTPVT